MKVDKNHNRKNVFMLSYISHGGIDFRNYYSLTELNGRRFSEHIYITVRGKEN